MNNHPSPPILLTGTNFVRDFTYKKSEFTQNQKASLKEKKEKNE
jgi:hypothetical protein